MQIRLKNQAPFSTNFVPFHRVLVSLIRLTIIVTKKRPTPGIKLLPGPNPSSSCPFVLQRKSINNSSPPHLRFRPNSTTTIHHNTSNGRHWMPELSHRIQMGSTPQPQQKGPHPSKDEDKRSKQPIYQNFGRCNSKHFREEQRG